VSGRRSSRDRSTSKYPTDRPITSKRMYRKIKRSSLTFLYSMASDFYDLEPVYIISSPVRFWIPEISNLMRSRSMLSYLTEYAHRNPDVEAEIELVKIQILSIPPGLVAAFINHGINSEIGVIRTRRHHRKSALRCMKLLWYPHKREIGKRYEMINGLWGSHPILK
jgi:hypothetical protein